MSEACRRLVSSRSFQNIVLVLILFSAVLIGLETDPVLPEASPTFALLRKILTGLFVIEIALRVVAEFPHPLRFLRSGWNVFDLIVVSVSLLPGLGTTALVLRLARVLRALRLVSALPGLRVVVVAAIRSLPAIGNVGMLLFLHFYVYAVVGVGLWGRNDPGHFGSVLRALLTLFRVLTLEDWTDVMYTQMLGSATYAPHLVMHGAVSHGEPVMAPIYFVSFVIIGTMVIMNLFVGVAVSAIQQAQEEVKRSMTSSDKSEKSHNPLDVLEQHLQEAQAQLASLRAVQPEASTASPPST